MNTVHLPELFVFYLNLFLPFSLEIFQSVNLVLFSTSLAMLSSVNCIPVTFSKAVPLAPVLFCNQNELAFIFQV